MIQITNKFMFYVKKAWFIIIELDVVLIFGKIETIKYSLSIILNNHNSYIYIRIKIYFS